MASLRLRLPANVAGDFYVDSTCIDCDLCRQIAPRTFVDVGEQSAVHAQPSAPEDVQAALRALVACPTASIGTTLRHDMRQAIAAFPVPVTDSVFFCGFAAESSFGASSYLVVRPEGNVLVDSPRWSSLLARRIEAMGGVATLFLTHQDDVADHVRWAKHFDATRVLHRDDWSRGFGHIETLIEGIAPVPLADDLLVIPTPGHTKGHCVLLFANRVLFSGDHLWWSDRKQGLVASPSVAWWSWPEQVRSLERLRHFEFEWVLPGHGRRAHAPDGRMRPLLEACIARAKGVVH